MALKEELMNSKKLCASFKAALSRVDDAANPDQPLFSAIVKASNDTPLSVTGASVSHIAGDIFTARDITLNGLKALVDSDRVSYIEGSRKMRIG